MTEPERRPEDESPRPSDPAAAPDDDEVYHDAEAKHEARDAAEALGPVPYERHKKDEGED